MTQQYIINNRPNGNRTVIIQEDPYLTGWNGFGYGWGARSLWNSRYVYNPTKTIIIKQERNGNQNQRQNIPVGRPLQQNKKSKVDNILKQSVQKQNSFENYMVSSTQSTKLYQCEGHSKQTSKLIVISLTNTQFCDVSLNYLSKLKIKVGSSFDTFHTLNQCGHKNQFFLKFNNSQKFVYLCRHLTYPLIFQPTFDQVKYLKQDIDCFPKILIVFPN